MDVWSVSDTGGKRCSPWFRVFLRSMSIFTSWKASISTSFFLVFFWLSHAIDTGWLFQIFFNFNPYLGKFPILASIFQRGWNHQTGYVFFFFLRGVDMNLWHPWIHVLLAFSVSVGFCEPTNQTVLDAFYLMDVQNPWETMKVLSPNYPKYSTYGIFYLHFFHTN